MNKTSNVETLSYQAEVSQLLNIVTNSLYSSWDDQFYSDIKGWFVKADVDPSGGFTLDKDFFMDFGDQRTHQVRLQGGDSSSDSFCFPNEE